MTTDRLREYRWSDFNGEWIKRERRGRTVSVCIPARNEEAGIVGVVRPLVKLRDQGVVDEVIVADDSTDHTASLARAHGATVIRQADIRPDLGPPQGKGDAMWRAAQAATGNIVVFLDGDSGHVGEHYAIGLLGPIIFGVADFVKGFYRRPYQHPDGRVDDHGGGRVTEILAKPLLRRFHPDLAAFHQPLAGEIAITRRLLEWLPFRCGYAVDVALLIDAHHQVGLGRMAQVDLESRQNRHRPLHELAAMADQVLAGAVARHDQPTRPPIAELAAA